MDGRYFVQAVELHERSHMPEPCSSRVILLAEEDILVRLGLAEFLRACGRTVIEAAGALEAMTILRKGPRVGVLLLDVQLASAGNGFALARWTRRQWPAISIVLTGSLASKAEAAANLCDRSGKQPPSKQLRQRIQRMRRRGARGGAAAQRFRRRD
jgi:CheY-like chemotaxis protein